VIGPVPSKQVEFLANVTLFADVTPRLVVGVETNLNQVVGGETGVLCMPQLHYEIDRHWMIQGGVGHALRPALRCLWKGSESSESSHWGNFRRLEAVGRPTEDAFNTMIPSSKLFR
jgi:hypothetical protein